MSDYQKGEGVKKCRHEKSTWSNKGIVRLCDCCGFNMDVAENARLREQLVEMADWLLEAFEDLKNDAGYCSVSDGPIEQRTRAIKKDLEG